MKFTKMHGIGNDYVYVNCFEETVEDPCGTARILQKYQSLSVTVILESVQMD